MLIDRIHEGEQMAGEFRISKDAEQVEARYVAWHQSVTEELCDDALALARFRRARGRGAVISFSGQDDGADVSGPFPKLYRGAECVL